MKSPGKAMKEAGMKNQFKKDLKNNLQKTYTAIHKKKDTSRLDKVHQRIGRAKNKHKPFFKIKEAVYLRQPLLPNTG